MPTAIGFTAEERRQLDHDGFVVCRGVVAGEHLAALREAFDEQWRRHGALGRVYHQQLLACPRFIELIEHPAILGRQRDVFGEQVQLLSLDLLRQGPCSTSADYAWHRDFVFPGDEPLAVNTLLYLDDIDDASGPTRVVPGTHRGRAQPPGERCGGPLAGQETVHAQAGDATFINAAVWHTGGRNRSAGERRVIYLYYGWWWLKPYFQERGPIPWQAYAGATPQRLSLLGQRMPGPDLHMY